MKKILLLLLLFSFITLNQAKPQSRISHQEYTQTKSHNQHPSKNSRHSKKSSHTTQNSKHTKTHSKTKAHHSQQHHYLHWQQPAFWWNTILAILLSCAGGFFSGMTVGLNSLDKLTLEVQKITGNDEQKQRASRILNTIKDHHLFLVTLLIGNAMVLEYLPLVVHKLMPDWAAILMSTFAVVIVAQIVPMAYTTGPSKYKVAYQCAPLVDFCIKVYYVIAYPIARGLDRLLGIHDTTHIKRSDFLSFVSDKNANHLKPLQITMFNHLFVGPNFTSVQNIMIPVNQIMVLAMHDEMTKQISEGIAKNQVVYVLIAKTHEEAHNFNIFAAVKTQTFVRQYLRKKNSLQRSILKISQFIATSTTVLEKHSSQKIPVIYSDAGLLDLLGILRSKKSSVALIHKEKRRKQDTDIAFLDASDFQASYDPFSTHDKNSIIGMVMKENIYEAITDFNNEMTPQFQMNIKEENPVKNRKLVKKASIVSSYSVSSSRSFS